MSAKRILIVGAGALGITCAYHLKLAGADISFYVRPHRLEALSRPQKLYCFNDDTVKTLEDYKVLSTPDELRGAHFEVVLLTLDASTCRSEQGTASLNILGRELADTGANLIICGVGLGLYEHVKKVTGFSEEHILQGTMRMFAYQVADWQEPVKPPTKVTLYEACDIAYLGFENRIGFFMASSPRRGARAFVELWDASLVSRCQLMPANVYNAFSNAFFPFTVASELQGWKSTKLLVSDEKLWPLCCDAQREIFSLREFGLTGKVMAWMMSNKRLAKMMLDMDEGGKRIGFAAFNRFHHGGKVLDQDIGVLRDCIHAGERAGKSMAATSTLLTRWEQAQR